MIQILNKFKYYIIAVLLLILILSGITSHSDLFNVAKPAVKILSGDFSMTYKSESGEILYSSFFPPAFHYIDALFYLPFEKLGVYNFDLNNIPADKLLIDGLLLKLRYLVLFILSLFLIIGVARNYESDKKERDKIFLLWLLSPVLIFIPFSWGNNDIYPMFLILFFLFFAFRKKYIWAMVFLGLSAATKNFALFLIPIMALILADKKIWKTVLYGVISILIYVIPWFLYRELSGTAIASGGEGLFILQKRIFDGPLFFPLAYFSILLFLIFKQRIDTINKNQILVKYGLLTMSLFYLSSFFIPHWFLWVLPFFVLTAYKDKRFFYLYVLINCAFFFGIYSWSRNIDMNLFSVAFPVINKVMTLGEFIVKFFPDFKIFEIVSSLFFAAFGLYLYLLFFDFKVKNDSKKELFNWEVGVFSLVPLFMFLLISFSFVFLMVNIRNRDWYDVGLSSRREVIGPVLKSDQFYQTFRSPKNGLIGINLFLSTYGKKIETPYKLILLDASCKNKILETNIMVDKIDDNAYREVLFTRVDDSKDKDYCFTVSPSSFDKVLTPITLHYSKYGSYDSGKLILGNKEVKGEDAVFQLIYPLK